MTSHRRRLAAPALALGVALSIAACDGGSGAQVPDAVVDARAIDAVEGGGDAAVDASIDAWVADAFTDPCALGCPTGIYDIDDSPLTGTCGCEYACSFVSASDAHDVAFTDDNCDGGDGIVDACVYVSASQGLDAQAGTRAMPMQTITAALQQAQANSVPFVCLSGEVYSETYTVPSGIGVVGSFDHLDADFPFRREAGITTTVNGSTLP